jgi:hypothetical protein
MQPHNSTEHDICVTVIDALPDDPQDALCVLASIVEAVTHSIGEPLPDFIKRVEGWRGVRS